MSQLEVFFDYACPYCLEGHHNLLELLPSFPQIEVVWQPCESHPRPERHGMHSDLCIQGMFFAAEQGADLSSYHERAYSLLLQKRINVEKIDILTEALSDLLDANALHKALESGQYRTVQEASNDYAYEESGVWIVPAYRMDGNKLDSKAGRAVTKEQLRAFLTKNIMEHEN